MGLSYDLTRCADMDALDRDILFPICVHMAACGIQRIADEDQLVEFLTRVGFLSDLNQIPEPNRLTAAQVHPFIGLATNVRPETAAAWRKRIVDAELARHRSNARRALRNMEAPCPTT